MEHSLLKDVNMLSQQWTVKVRLTRFSEFLNIEKPPRLIRIDLVLLDEEGTTMEGQVPENRIPFFKARVKEDFVYEISFFQVCQSRIRYRAVNHEYMMRFTQHTTVTEVTNVPPNFPRYACDIATYETLRDRVGKTDFCSDAIGLFTGCLHVRPQNTRNGTKPLREVYLTDGMENIVVTLWEHHAEKFDADQYISMGAQRPVVILFVGVTCLLFNDKLSLQSASPCKWYIDPQIPETEEIKYSCGAKTPLPAWATKNPSHSALEKITVHNLAKFTNPHVIFTNRYITDVRIKNLLPGRPRWYPACKICRKGTIPNGEGVICKNRNCTGTVACPRYRLALIAEDPAPAQPDQEPAFIELVAFGPKAQELIGVPAERLISDNCSNEDFVPSQISNLYGKCFELSLSVSPYSLQNPTIIYQVDAIIGTVSHPTNTEASTSKVTGADMKPTITMPPVPPHDSQNQEDDSSLQPLAIQSSEAQKALPNQEDDSSLQPLAVQSSEAQKALPSSSDTTIHTVIPLGVVPPDTPQLDRDGSSQTHSKLLVCDVNKELPRPKKKTKKKEATKSKRGRNIRTTTTLHILHNFISLMIVQLHECIPAAINTEMTPPQTGLSSQEMVKATSRGKKRRSPEEPDDSSDSNRDVPAKKERASKRRLQFTESHPTE